MTLGPDVWGPPGWKFLHFVALAYPENPTEEDKFKYKNFFTLIQDVLPCSICREHYKQHLVKYPLDDDTLLTTKSLLHWTIDVHNEVNIATKKRTLSYEEAIASIKSRNLVVKTDEPNEILNKPNESHNKTKASYNKMIKQPKISTNYTEPENKPNKMIYGIILIIIVIFLILKTKKI